MCSDHLTWKTRVLIDLIQDKLSMFMYHGKNDAVIDWKRAKQGYDMMIGDRPNFQLTLVPYLQHSVYEDQLKETTDWILAKLKENKIEEWKNGYLFVLNFWGKAVFNFKNFWQIIDKK